MVFSHCFKAGNDLKFKNSEKICSHIKAVSLYKRSLKRPGRPGVCYNETALQRYQVESSVTDFALENR
jgi:hypothetical protein